MADTGDVQMADTAPSKATPAAAATGTGPEQPSQQPALPLLAPGSDVTLYGWVYNPVLTPDDNYLDLALAVSRNSLCEGGHMGPSEDPPTSPGQLLMVAINSTLFDLCSHKSDVHAEQNAISAAAKTGLCLQGSTAYITMPPCRTCFGLLQAAGVKRVVFRRKNHLPEIDAAAVRLGITLVGNLGHKVEDASLERVKQLWAAYRLNNPALAEQELEAQKLAQKAAKESRKRKAAEKAQVQQQAEKKANQADEAGQEDGSG